MSQSDHMDSISSPPNSHDHVSFLDDDDHDFSTGYLQDVLFEFSSKRRRLLMFADHHHDGGRSDVEISSMQNCWTSNLIQNCCQEFDSLTQITKSSPDVISEMKRGEEQTVSESYEHYSSSSSSQKEMSSADNQWTTTPEKRNLYCIDDHDTMFSSGIRSYTFSSLRLRGLRMNKREKKEEGGSKGGVSICPSEAGRIRRGRDVERHQRENPYAAYKASTPPGGRLRLPAVSVARRAGVVRKGRGGVHKNPDTRERHNNYYKDKRLIMHA
ncbi:UNVERIFIED_CONTAM: hypothetical protein Sangu_1756500 [Sesamum angustifolium]|uniref:Uncharacterized protein n=1 Tax=Sesamum angustifolium TaxID=2727405 RepID=A0AAW2M8C5_9LAMI